MRGIVGSLARVENRRALFFDTPRKKNWIFYIGRIESTNEINLAIFLIAVVSHRFIDSRRKFRRCHCLRERELYSRRDVFVKRHIKLTACVLRELTIVVIMDVHRIIAAAELSFFENTICIASRWWFLSTICAADYYRSLLLNYGLFSFILILIIDHCPQRDKYDIYWSRAVSKQSMYSIYRVCK